MVMAGFTPAPFSLPVISQARPLVVASMLRSSRVATWASLLAVSMKKHSVMSAPSMAFSTDKGSARGVLSTTVEVVATRLGGWVTFSK